MNKLYKYRPLSEFLFKELYYQELYFASYKELNDPLDLSARIEFNAENENQIEYLIRTLFKSTLKIPFDNLTELEMESNRKLVAFNKNIERRKALKSSIYKKLAQLKTEQKFIWFDSLEDILLQSIEEQKIEFNFNVHKFKHEIQRLTQKFLENSYTSCFTESNNDFLMWSHYASKHSGICLEFTLENSGMFPYILNGKRKPDHENYLQMISDWEVNQMVFWDTIHKVNYKNQQPFINFFEFSPVFQNEHDCDLIGFSKPWTHKFARELELVFSTKTLPWSYEKEWRAIDINFGEPQLPEERIRHYPIEVISSIFFGVWTPDDVKRRIQNIFAEQGRYPQYFNCKLTNGRDLDFEIWEESDETNLYFNKSSSTID